MKLNGTALAAFASPGSFLSLNRTWKSGDKIELNLPMDLHVEPMPDNDSVQAIMYGPLVLAGTFDVVPNEMSYGNYEPKPDAQKKVPDIIADPANPTAWVEPDARQSLRFHAAGQSQAFPLVPLYQVIHNRYSVYWNVKDRKNS